MKAVLGGVLSHSSFPAVRRASPLHILCSPLQDVDNLTAKSLLQFQVLFRIIHYTEISTQAFKDNVAILATNPRFQPPLSLLDQTRLDIPRIFGVQVLFRLQCDGRLPEPDFQEHYS